MNVVRLLKVLKQDLGSELKQVDAFAGVAKGEFDIVYWNGDKHVELTVTGIDHQQGRVVLEDVNEMLDGAISMETRHNVPDEVIVALRIYLTGHHIDAETKPEYFIDRYLNGDWTEAEMKEFYRLWYYVYGETV